MAIRQGRCPNCGSIINIDENKDNYCIFCWAKVDAEQAVKLNEDATGYTFPNKEFEEVPSDEEKQSIISMYQNNVHASAKSKKTTSSQPAPKKKVEEKKLTPAEQVAKLNQPKLEIKLNKKAMVGIVAGAVAIVVVAIAISIPIARNRDEARNQISTKMSDQFSDIKDISIKGFSNQHLDIVLSKSIDESQASKIFEEYTAIRKNVYGEGSNGGETAVIYSNDNSFKIKVRDGKPLVEKMKDVKNTATSEKK